MKTLRQQFGDDFSSSAFKKIGDEENIVGKYGRIMQLDDGSFDCWFVGSDLTPLTTQKLNAIANNLRVEGKLHRLDGEAWVQGRGRDFVLKVAPLAGVKRKRRYSAETAAKHRQNLEKLRAGGA